MRILVFITLLLGGFFLLQGQNVGIGVATPTEKLDIAGNLQFSGALMPGGQPGTFGQILMSTGPGSPPAWIVRAIDSKCGAGNANYVVKWTGASSVCNSIIYDTGTQVGIGTTTPGGMLQVNANASTGLAITGLGTSSNGVFGLTTGAASAIVGMAGTGATNIGSIFGVSVATSGGHGVQGAGAANGGSGVFGSTTTDQGYGVFALNSHASGTGLIATGNNSGTFYFFGGGGGSASTGTLNGVTGVATANDNGAYGVYGEYAGNATADGRGVYGWARPAANWGYGVYGYGGWRGVYGYSDGVGVYGTDAAGGNFGVFSNGNMGATGTKPFVIDHPADPANKELRHFSIESNEVLNVYRGNVVLNNQGKATIQLPDYFHLINANFSYVLTPIGAPAQVYVLQKIDENGQFVIAGGNPGQEISWYVYAERNDPYLQKYPQAKQVVLEKAPKIKGKYYRPELYGQPAEKGVDYLPEYKLRPQTQKAKHNPQLYDPQEAFRKNPDLKKYLLEIYNKK